MSLPTLNIAPGIYTEGTDRSSKNRWKDGSNVRFREGLPLKEGGSAVLTNSQVEGDSIVRKLHRFTVNNGTRYECVATNIRWYIWDGGALTNITPIRDSTAAPFSSTVLSDPFSTTAASSLVTVTHTAHGVLENTFVFFDTATASPLDLILIDGWYQVVSVTDDDNFVIDSGVVATNSEPAFGGASVDWTYELNAGAADTFLGLGWGAGPWRAGGTYTNNRGWGEAEPGGTGVTNEARMVFVDSWGEDLIIAPRGGTVYTWDASAGVSTSNRATEIANAPDTVEGIIVTPKNRQIIAFGAHDGSASNRRMIRYCATEDYNDWTPTNVNDAGDFIIDDGSRLMFAVNGNNQTVLLSDSACYSMYPLAFPDVFGLQNVGSECGAISPNCGLEVNGTVLWKGQNNYFKYDGTVTTLHCDIRNVVYADLNRQQATKIYAYKNADFHEARWGYVSANATEIDSYSSVNYEEWWWSKGMRPITAWADEDEGFVKPIAALSDGQLYTMETGVDEGSEALSAFIESYDAQVENQNGAGDNFMLIKKLIPDFKELSGSVLVTLKGRQFPHSSQKTKGPKVFTLATLFRGMRIRARQVCMRVESNDIGDHWHMGPWSVQTREQGLGKR